MGMWERMVRDAEARVVAAAQALARNDTEEARRALAEATEDLRVLRTPPRSWSPPAPPGSRPAR